MKIFSRKERKVFETYQKQLLAKPNRKERQEIEALRDEVCVCMWVPDKVHTCTYTHTHTINAIHMWLCVCVHCM